MRILTAVTVAMGVLILLGTTVLVITLVERSGGPSPAAIASVILDEPAGTRISGIAAVADRLAVALQGGGPDRVVLIDPRSGAVAGRITLRR
ncbi:MAG TPA: hypothetical protein VFW75_05460 [Acetobacteraceae bacterium]|nr:hypothetical protein [Acetobacteraceae bacterium]